MYSKYASARKVAFYGLLFALALVFSFVESLIPAIPMLPPGVKLGLSNIVVMYSLFFLGLGSAFSMVVLKSLFVLLTRMPVGALMSITGGILSLLIMAALLMPKKLKISYLIVSIAGGVFHNLGQLVAASLIVSSSFVLYYIPVMVISGVIMGLITGFVLRAVKPYLGNIGKKIGGIDGY